MSLSWTPVKKGLTYCAPACGCGCTYASYLKAHRLGRQALKQLHDKRGWKVRVWENTGWHVQLQKAGLNLHISSFDGIITSYHSLLSRERGGSGGNPEWTENFYHADPNVVIERQIKLARRVLAKQAKAVAGFEYIK